MSALRVFVVDDHPVVTLGVRALLAGEGMIVVGTAGGAEAALRALGEGGVDVVIVDLHLGRPILDGIALIEALGSLRQPPRAVVYSMHEDADTIARALAAGARGYVSKGEVWQTLVRAIRVVGEGGRFLGPAAARALGELDGGPAEGHAHLSEREREVFRLLGEGFGVSEIATRLDLSARTVESFCARIIDKLGLSGMRELRRAAIGARSP